MDREVGGWVRFQTNSSFSRIFEKKLACQDPLTSAQATQITYMIAALSTDF